MITTPRTPAVPAAAAREAILESLRGLASAGMVQAQLAAERADRDKNSVDQVLYEEIGASFGRIAVYLRDTITEPG